MPMRRYAAVYFLLLAALFAIETTDWAQRFTVGTWTRFLADISGGMIAWFDPTVVVQGADIRNSQTGFAVSIKAGCNGVEAAMLLAAAILAYPAAWVSKLLGMVVGVTAIQLLNIIRIITLFYLGEWSQKALTIAHLYVWPGLIILDALIFFLIWMHWQGRSTPRPAAS